jgi:excisionase family DNA binding protein
MVAAKKKGASVPVVEMYDVEQAAQYLGVHSRTIIREINRGNLEAYKIGKGFKVKRAELDRYLETHKVKSESHAA